jgi:leucyl aminopeptidase
LFLFLFLFFLLLLLLFLVFLSFNMRLSLFFTTSLFLLLSSSCLAFVSLDKPNDEAQRLILFALEDPPIWLPQSVVDQLIRQNVGFMDITEHPDEDKAPRVTHQFAFPSGPSHQNEVNNLKNQVRMTLVQSNLETLSSFFTRYYRSTTGEQSAQWVFNKALEYANNRSDITINQFAHSGYNQKSVIARIAGRDNTLPIVIVSAHQDSINSRNPANGRSPGSDDDGSGTVTILEAFRVLSSSNFKPLHPIEFQWYAAEEVGLFGSQDIASNYRSNGKQVYGAMQFDMTGYYTTSSQLIRVINDYVNRDLTTFTKQLIDAYLAVGRRDYSCGYACSDHASWYRSGYASASTFEAVTTPHIHTATDDISTSIKWDSVEQFVFFAIAYAVELSYGE